MAEYRNDIPGMRVFEEIISPEFEQMIIQAVENPENSVHVQPHRNFTVWEYGWIYNNGCITYAPDESRRADDIPFAMLELFRVVTMYLKTVGVNTEFIPDHCMVNRYLPGEGIYSHVDDVKYWGDWVVGVCIGSGATMRMTGPGGEKESIYLFPRSIYLLESDSRFTWRHEIPAHDVDNVGGVMIPRGIRYALTFREIKVLSDDLREEFQEFPKFLRTVQE
jgi:alkylated DNA repair dioxygenase AlkB